MSTEGSRDDEEGDPDLDQDQDQDQEINKKGKRPYELGKGYEIDFDDDTKYHVKVGLSKSKKLKISVIEMSKYNNIYESKYDHSELIRIDRFFSLFETIEDIIAEIDSLFLKNLVSVSIDMSHNVIVELQININNKHRVIRLKLQKRGSEQADALNNLCNLVSAQTKKLDVLQDENNRLKEQLGLLNHRLGNIKGHSGGDDDSFVKPSRYEGYSSNDRSSRRRKKSKKKKGDDEDESNEGSLSSSKRRRKKIPFDFNAISAESGILENIKDVDFLIDKINSIFKEKNKEFSNLSKLYHASEDGDSPNVFHSQCDGICPLLVFVRTTKGKRFGGFASVPFESCVNYKGKKDSNAFIFSIDKHTTYDVEKGKSAICCYKNYGPVFYGYEYCNIYLIGNFFTTNGNVAKKHDRYNTTEDYELNGGEQKFLTEELEVYEVILQELDEDDEKDE